MPHANPPVFFNFTQAAQDAIMRERWRQLRVEGFTFAHDDAHVDGELARAAGYYAMFAGLSESDRAQIGNPPQPSWPWEKTWWKSGPDASNESRRRELVKAGALILAELERLGRMERPDYTPMGAGDGPHGIAASTTCGGTCRPNTPTSARSRPCGRCARRSA